MCTEIGISFKNCHFLKLIPPFLADETIVFSIKNHRFLREKARNEAIFQFLSVLEDVVFAMRTWQITVFCFLFR